VGWWIGGVVVVFGFNVTIFNAMAFFDESVMTAPVPVAIGVRL
jgi:hypothetical protein